MTDLHATLRAPEPMEGRLAGASKWHLGVVSAEPLTPSVVRLILTSPGLEALGAKPGHDLMFAIPDGAGSTINRRYSIRHVTAGDQSVGAVTVTVDVVVHGEGPGSRWASTAKPGDTIEAIGPRGQVTVDDASTAHLFVGDASGAPAMLAMLEAVPADRPAHAVLVVDDGERHPTSAPDHRITWLTPSDDLDAAVLASLEATAADLTTVQVCLTGERADVRRLRDLLVAHGIPADRLQPKPYWAKDEANAGHGEPNR